MDQATPVVKPWSRIVLMLAAIAVLLVLSRRFTGSFLPTNPSDALIFQNALLLVVFGSALIEHKFTKPGDSVVNSLMGMVTLLTVYGRAPQPAWWGVFLFCGVVFVLSAACTSVNTGPYLTGWQEIVARYTYRPAVFLGAARRLYSILFLFGLFSFYSIQSNQTLALVLFWGLFVVAWPLGVPEFLSSLKGRESAPPSIGRVVRTDWPDLVRVALEHDSFWESSQPAIYVQPNGSQRWIVPLYSQVQKDGHLGTGLCLGILEDPVANLRRGFVYTARIAGFETVDVSDLLDAGTSSLVGFVVEGSDIGQIKFETWSPGSFREGLLVWCCVGSDRIYYQITNGTTREESIESDRHGFQVAEAAQLGTLGATGGFRKFSWLPPMNTPVFLESRDFGEDVRTVEQGDFVFGKIPNSEIKIGGPFLQTCDHHTAILGITGSGKTELAFDLIRHAAQSDQKVICIDLTAKYRGRLADLSPEDLSISSELAKKLGDKLFAVETGTYGAGKEKKALKLFDDELRTEVSSSIDTFLTSGQDGPSVGIIELTEISNTKATLFITELYMTCLLHFARDKSDSCPPVLVVVEEAHTVMPEPSTMGLGDYDSRGLVSKIAQLALQGRKYGVGLLVVAQRTATVSKTVLTQCNTIISFTCFDDTSLNFLKNIFGAAHIRLIPNLPPLHAVVFGKAVRSERPVEIEIAFDQAKADEA